MHKSLTNKYGLFRTTVSAMLSLEKQAILWSRNSGIKIIKMLREHSSKEIIPIGRAIHFQSVSILETKNGYKIQLLNDLFLKHFCIFMAISLKVVGVPLVEKLIK